MAEAVIVEAVRSPVGKRNGGLSGVHPAELSAQVLNGLAERTGIDPGIVDDVAVPHSLQNLAVGDDSVPQDVHVTRVWFHPYRRYAGGSHSHLR